MARAPRPEDLYALRVPMDLAISPDGRWVCFSVKAVAPGKDAYRTSLWIVAADGSEPPRQLTLGALNDTLGAGFVVAPPFWTLMVICALAVAPAASVATAFSVWGPLAS